MTFDAASASSAAGTFEPAAAADASIGAKVNKVVESLRQKNAKLAEDNKKLREALSATKSGSTRIRRIPKKKTDE